MEYTLTIHALATEDILEIARWYDLQLAGLGSRFALQLEIALTAIQKNPTAHTKATDETRKAFLKKFPYIIFFEIKETNILICGVMHSRRKPSLMKSRYSKIRKQR
ncbi:MAG: type II toxin-antitoxin system RelE/ParE family toxin [Lacibacter sp.]